MKKKCAFSDLIIGLGCAGLGAAVFFLAQRLQKVKLGIGPGGFPRFIGIALMILGAIQLIKVIKNGIEKPKVHIEKKALLLFLSTIAVCLLYVAVVSYLDFRIATPLLLFAMLLLYGNKHYLFCALFSVGFSLAVWWLFTKVFMVFLPKGILF